MAEKITNTKKGRQPTSTHSDPRPASMPYTATHHLGGYHSQAELDEDLLGRGAGDLDHFGNPERDFYDSIGWPEAGVVKHILDDIGASFGYLDGKVICSLEVGEYHEPKSTEQEYTDIG
jgi:hypothetical protein